MLRNARRRWKVMADADIAVRRRLPWQLKFLLTLLAVAVLAFGGWLSFEAGYDAGRNAEKVLLPKEAQRFAQKQTDLIADMTQKIQTMSQEMRVEVTTHQSLAKEIQQLHGENRGLRDQVAFYESLLTRGSGGVGLTVETFKAEAQGSGRYLLGMVMVQGQAKSDVFKGEVDFVLTYELKGQLAKLTKPVPRLPISVVRFHRVESMVEVPEGARLKQVEVRVFGAGDGRPKLSRLFEVKG